MTTLKIEKKEKIERKEKKGKTWRAAMLFHGMYAASPEKGATLIGVLITIVLSSILLLGVYSAFSTINFLDMNTQDQSRLNASTRTALLLMDSNIENAGFLLFGALGGSDCKTLLTYNSAVNSTVVNTVYAVQGGKQNTGNNIPGTTIPFTYAGPGNLPTDYVTTTSAGTFTGSGPLGNGLFNIVKVNNGTLNNSSLFLSSTANIAVNNIDIVILPSTGVCIRFQITNVGGANNAISNSGLSNINPPKGFNGVSENAYPAIAPITLTEFQNAYVEDLGTPTANMGPVQTTFSIENNNGTQSLYQTSVNGQGQVIENSPLINNVVDMQLQYGVLTNGHIIYHKWTTSNATSITTVKLALLLRSPHPLKNFVSPATIPMMNGISYSVPASMDHYSYNMIKRVIVLRNVQENVNNG
jgi:hypothetical protein